MTDKPAGQSQPARLLHALETPQDLDGAHVRELLPAFVEAEAAGIDVDTRPEYAALLKHLDSCHDCTTLYAELAAELETLLQAEAAPQPVLSTPPTFFAPARQTPNLVLRVLGSVRRAFQLDLRVQLPAHGTLGGGQSANLFADTLPEVSGAPLLAVSFVAGQEGNAPALLVAVHGTSAPGPWEVQLTTPSGSRHATTDAQGIARFEGVYLANDEQIQLSFRELRNT